MTKQGVPPSQRFTIMVAVEVAKKPTNECADWLPPSPSEVAAFVRVKAEDQETDDGWFVSQVWAQ